MPPSLHRRQGLIDHRTPRPHECDDRCKPHECEGLAENTIRQIHYLLSGAYKKAVRWGWVSVSPIDSSDAPAPSRANPQPPSPEEAAAIINRAWRNDVDWGTHVWLKMVTGSRRGETCAVRWRHLTADYRVLHMQKAIAQDGREIWETDTKTHQDRRIVLDEQTVELLVEHRQRCVARAEALGIELSDDAFVFSPEPDGSVPPRPDTITQRYRRLVQRLGIDTHLHALRHYSATELIAAGVDVRTVAGRLGHGGGGTTTLRVYTAWLSEADQRAPETLSGRMPDRPAVLDPTQRALVSPEAVFEQVTWKIRQQVLDGVLVDGGPAPVGRRAAGIAPRYRLTNNGYIVTVRDMAVDSAPRPTADGPAPGSPAWWSARPSPQVQPTRGRPPRSFERIIAAASELVDEVGTGTFSMRLLADRLQTSTATLYRHVANKDELMVLVVDRLFAALRVAGEAAPDELPRSWQEAALRAASRFRQVLAQHPNVLPLLVSQVPIGPNGLAVREQAIAVLVRFGFSPRLAARAYTTIAHYVIGFAVQQYSPGAPGPEDAAALGAYFRTLDPEVYPHTVVAVDALTEVSLDDEFLEGLQFILDGIEHARLRH